MRINLLTRILLTLIAGVAAIVPAIAADYTSSSVLGNGKWAAVSVNTTGMQLLTNEKLRQLGFTDPSKVYVYGYGGRPISSVLTSTMVNDDLPPQPVVRTQKGIVFFGTDAVKWGRSTASTNGKFYYTHSPNYYSTESVYFISDVAPEDFVFEEVDRTSTDTPNVTTFLERLLHEKETAALAESTPLMLGEDFRINTSQSFPFTMPGKADSFVGINVRFVAKASAASYFYVSANGSQLPTEKGDQLPVPGRSAPTGSATISRKTTTVDGENLNVGIRYQQAGVLYTARLDWIEVNYNRNLSISDGPLYFYLYSDDSSTAAISGAGEDMELWDVTNPAAPKRVKYTLNGSQAHFRPDPGYREYVAFEPSRVTTVPTGGKSVTNQNIHSMAVPDMLIVAPKEWLAQAQRLATFHENNDGLKTVCLTPEQVYNEFSSGTADVAAFRKLSKMWYDRSKAGDGDFRYLLMMGRPTYDFRNSTGTHGSFPRLPWYMVDIDLPEQTSYDANYSIGTDMYFGHLTDLPNYSATTEDMMISVGRMPVKSAAEASAMVDKIIQYSTSANLDAWLNNVMIIADDEDNNIHLKECETVIDTFRGTEKGKSMVYERLYLDSYERKYSGVGHVYPEAKSRMLKMIDEGCFWVTYVGHGHPKGWGHENLLVYEDILNFSNKNYPVILTSTCDFAPWDEDAVSGGELMWLHEKSGAVALISTTRATWTSNNWNFCRNFYKTLATLDAEGNAPRLGDVYRVGMNGYYDSLNRLPYVLIGDPAMRLMMPTYTAVVDSIGETDLTNPAAESPVIGARGRVKISGRILDHEGNDATDFNGTLVPTLYDAERVIETLGQGDRGESIIYNDRKNKLFTSRVQVKEGRWEFILMMPAELDNNYKPALLNLYAVADDRRHASGFTERLYAYGWDENAPEDNEGPEIELFTLNSPLFSSGDAVAPAPLVMARLRDESGINISSAGIGHKMTLTLDGKKTFDDVLDNFIFDPEDPLAGDVAYQLTDLEPGRHTLKLTAWDNANNSSTAELEFSVAVNAIPTLYDVVPDCNPARTSVTFSVAHDWPDNGTRCTVDIFDLSGRKVWSGSSGPEGKIIWNLADGMGARVGRGIYLYRATVVSPKGTASTKTKKIAVAAN